MSYAGNSSLSSDVQKRILGTFEQTLGLAAEGNRQEALLGCDFVLRMDPQFEPARRLQERLNGNAGPVRVDDLLAPSPSSAAPDPFADDGLSLELPDLDLPDFGAVSAPAAGGQDLRSRFQSLLDGRRFQELMTLAQQEQAAVGADPELMRIASTAQERMEAEPYAAKFLASAREAARQGQRDDAARLIEKVRALDPSHPGLAELEGGAPAAAPAPADTFGMAPAAAPEDTGFELSFDEPSAGLGFGTELPDLSFDDPAGMMSLDEPAALDAAPSLPPPIPAMAPLGGGDSESDRRIQQLLDEGQGAYDMGDLQSAIDAWSRIFLIDIDHQEAARRIELARKLKAESERQAEEVFHEGLAKVEAGDLEGARQIFQRVLEIQPSYFAAREYLQQLEAGTVPVARPAPRDASAPPALPLPSDLELGIEGGELKEEILIPPDPAEVAAAERQKPRKAAAPGREGRARKRFAVVGSLVLLLVLAGAVFVYLNKDRLFPNSETAEPGSGAPEGASGGADPIARAMDLHKAGKTSIALAQLRRIAPEDPQYQEAQTLISQLASAAPAPAVPSPQQPPAAAPAPAPPPISAQRQAAIDAARQAYQGGSYLDAIERLEAAQKQGPLDPADAELLANARRQIQPLSNQLDLFRQHEWEHALHDLWRMREADPGNRDVARLMVDSYYNLGLRDLQRMDTAKAAENFREALGLDPNDQELKRQLQFAETYQQREKDLLYRIYVKHLPLR